MIMIRDFKDYWSKTKGMLNFKAQLMSGGNNRIPILEIVNYYKTEIVENLWFSEHFPNKYNNWVEINLPPFDSRRLKVKEIMLNISISPLIEKKKTILAVVGGILIFVIAILMILVFFSLWYVYIPLLIMALFLVGWGGYSYKCLTGFCGIDSIEAEMIRIENEIVKLLN